FSYWQHAAAAVAASMARGQAGADLARQAPRAAEPMRSLLATSQQLVDEPRLLRAWSDGVAALARGTLGHLPAADQPAPGRAPAWLAAEALAIPEVAAELEAYDAAAPRDARAMRTSAERVLALPEESLSPRLREQMLVLAMLGALGT